MGVDEVGVDEMGSRRSGTAPLQRGVSSHFVYFPLRLLPLRLLPFCLLRRKQKWREEKREAKGIKCIRWPLFPLRLLPISSTPIRVYSHFVYSHFVYCFYFSKRDLNTFLEIIFYVSPLKKRIYINFQENKWHFVPIKWI